MNGSLFPVSELEESGLTGSSTREVVKSCASDVAGEIISILISSFLLPSPSALSTLGKEVERLKKLAILRLFLSSSVSQVSP